MNANERKFIWQSRKPESAKWLLFDQTLQVLFRDFAISRFRDFAISRFLS